MDTPEPDPGTGLLAPGQDPGAPQAEPDQPEVEPREEPVPAAPDHVEREPAVTDPDPAADEATEGGAEPADDEIEAAVAPAVVAVMVTSDPGPWLEGALASLAEQEYPALSVLVLDNGSTEDPTPRIAQAAPHAFVRRLESNFGFAAAANDVMVTVEGATFLLFCHDDVVLAPDAVRIMVEEAYRSNAGVVGPKLVDYDDETKLLEVGMSIDHYGVPFSNIEPGELDQEQHDAVRDVFYVSNAVMLVRTDLFHELDGFDAATFPGFDDVDLCWRARLAGARILVAPEARVRHRRTTLQDHRPSRRDETVDLEAWTRGRVRVLMKSYSGLALVWVLPVAFFLNLIEAAALVIGRRPRRAAGLLGGWFDNIRQLRDVHRARVSTQRLRRVDDGDVRDLMVRGSARLRMFLAHRLHAGDRLADVSNRTRDAAARVRTRLRTGHVVLTAVIVVLIVIGSRALILDRVPQVGTLNDWPSMGALWSTFLSSWRYAMIGADAPGPPIFGLMALLSTALLGDTDLARTLVVAGAFPLGAWGAYRLARPLAPAALPAVVTALAYVVNPVVRNAVGEGHFGPLVAFALAPFLLRALLRAGAAAPDDRRARLHAMLSVALLTTIVAAAWPPALLFALTIGVAFLLAVPVAGGLHLSLRTLATAAAGTALAFVLLAPWSFDLLGARAETFGLMAREPQGLVDMLSFQTGRAGSGAAPWGLIVAGLLPLAVATGPRLGWASRAWMLTIVAWIAAWLPSRLDSSAPLPAPEGMLVLAALGLALAVGLGVAAFTDELRTFHFGWRQLAAVAAAVGLALPIMGLTADALQGRWGLSGDDWASRFEWMSEDIPDGGFRVLWLGDPTILPGDPHVVGGTGYLVTRDGPGDVRDGWAPPRTKAERELARAIEMVRAGRTVRFGHLLAPAGVRYVAVVERAAPESGRKAAIDPRLEAELGAQVDLTVSRVESSAVIYENESWIARRAVAPPDVEVPIDVDDPLEAATRDVPPTEAVLGPQSESEPAGPGTLLWSEAADSGWQATVDGATATRGDAFGWTNAFAVEERGSVDLTFDEGLRRVIAYLEMVAWFVVAALWWRSRSREQDVDLDPDESSEAETYEPPVEVAS